MLDNSSDNQDSWGDEFYDEDVDIFKLQKTVDMLTQIIAGQQRTLVLLERHHKFGSPLDPSLYPKYRLDGITLSRN